MPLLDDSDLADLFDFIQEAFDKEATVSRPGDAIPSKFGGETPVGIVRHTIPGKLRPSSLPRLVQRGAMTVSETVYLFRCAKGSDIRAKDDVEVDGVAYTVQETDAGRSMATVLTATLILSH